MNKFMVVIFLMLSNLQQPTLLAKDVYATFTVHAKKAANLAFTYSGIIQHYNVDIMSRVNKGDVIATLVNDDLIATINASKISLKYAKSDYKRYKDLLEQGLIDTAKFEKFALQYESIKAKIVYEDSINDKTVLRAPFDGIITQRMIEEGDVVSGQVLRTAFTINSEHDRILIVQFDQKYNKDVKLGDVFVYKVDGDNNEYSGTVDKIYPAANTETRKISVQVNAIDFKVGLFGEGKILASGQPSKSSTNIQFIPE